MKRGILALAGALVFGVAWADGATEAPFIVLSSIPAETLLGRGVGTAFEPGKAPAADAQLQFLCGASSEKGSLKSLPALGPCGELRTFLRAPSAVTVHYLVIEPAVDGRCPRAPASSVHLDFDETKRRTLLADGLKKVVEFLGGKSQFLSLTDDAENKDKAKAVDLLCDYAISYTLQHMRATLAIAARRDTDAETKVGASTKLTTGPIEHTFLSGDAIVRGADELHWDADAKMLSHRDKPQQLYLGFNYMLGDVYGSYGTWDWRNRLVIKALLSPTRKPFDSAGLGIGYRLSDGLLGGEGAQPNSGMVIFVGHFWSKGQDAFDAQGAAVDAKRQRSWRIGVSYSLDSLIDWIK